ncbi:uncharacterized protein BJ171DRAFT_64991 [Polychytrium aggregatum]|uniref:uncharacterized protein n=1 Tax=Polychytrium aggregatum TaxID=110093 RepID=UPI0022FDF61F|nr:uncharacterized protein BJ171DRAFT_64991 [Polychytrium aggregatum]KAI9205699.1 hypothetical protein BJ171DRAFT_64991 [Polychytrium aggregatum]
MASVNSGVEKTLSKLQKSVEDGNYYEAHQMYNSICQRYLKQRKVQEAVRLVHSGALNLQAVREFGSALDLCNRLLEIYDGQGFELNDQNRALLVELFDGFPVDEPKLKDFIKSSLKWSTKAGAPATGDPVLHHVFGLRFYRERYYYDAEHHFLQGPLESAKAAGYMAAEWSQLDTHLDPAYPIARTALALLAVNKPSSASSALDSYLQKLNSEPQGAKVDADSVSIQLHRSPLINFIKFILMAVERSVSASSEFLRIRAKYQDLLQVDPAFTVYVDKIAAIYFDLGPKRQSNPFEEIMRSLLGGGSQPQTSRRIGGGI